MRLESLQPESLPRYVTLRSPHWATAPRNIQEQDGAQHCDLRHKTQESRCNVQVQLQRSTSSFAHCGLWLAVRLSLLVPYGFSLYEVVNVLLVDSEYNAIGI